MGNMLTPHNELSLVSLDPEGHSRTCNYWYLVRKSHGPHTAFTNRDHLMVWLQMRNLTIQGDLAEHGKHSFCRIEGEYRTEVHWSYDEFFALDGIVTRGISNGQYTMFILTTDEDGIVTEHYMNCNCKHRPVYDYAESRAMIG